MDVLQPLRRRRDDTRGGQRIGIQRVDRRGGTARGFLSNESSLHTLWRWSGPSIWICGGSRGSGDGTRRHVGSGACWRDLPPNGAPDGRRPPQRKSDEGPGFRAPGVRVALERSKLESFPSAVEPAVFPREFLLVTPVLENVFSANASSKS